MNNAETKLTEKEVLHIGGVSGSITVKALERGNQRQILSKSKWFNPKSDYVVKDNGEYLTISRPDLDYRSKTYKAIKLGSGWIRLNILSEMPIGTFDFDEDSTEDELVVYYR